jgi:maltose alpha-D-glucosyltransferase/alpha-amylase
MKKLTKTLFALSFQLAAAVGVSAVAAEPVVITGKFEIPPGPVYLHDAVFYQIYPQTFFDTDADGIGDLQGIIEKLDYVKRLGVDGFWINPFFESPFNDAGYDVSDYYRVAPRYGTNEDARRLFDEAEKRGLKVLFDWVISYSSIDHPWFQASARQEQNEYSNWYIWTDNTWVDPPAAFRGAFIKGYGGRRLRSRDGGKELCHLPAGEIG